ncbi:MAG: hypothetical protein ACFCUG_12975 [Thiotrichales bacterium]
MKTPISLALQCAMPWVLLAVPLVAIAQPSGPFYNNQTEVRTYTTASRLQQWQDADNYYLDVLLVGVPVGAVNVLPRGSVLMVEITGGQRQQRVSPDGRASSFISSSQHLRRPVQLPRDADVTQMRRQDLGDRVRVILPKRPVLAPPVPIPGLAAEPDARL